MIRGTQMSAVSPRFTPLFSERFSDKACIILSTPGAFGDFLRVRCSTCSSLWPMCARLVFGKTCHWAFPDYIVHVEDESFLGCSSL